MFVIVICIAMPVVLVFSLWLYSFFVVRENKKPVADTSHQMVIQGAPIAEIIGNYWSWIYVRKDKQIGIVNNKIYYRSGYIFDFSAEPQESFIISLQEYQRDISIKTVSGDNLKNEVIIHVRFSARPKYGNEIIKAADPLSALLETIKTVSTKFIQGYGFRRILENRTKASLDLQHEIRHNIPYYNIFVNAISTSSQIEDNLDEIARFPEQAEIKAFEVFMEMKENQAKIDTIKESFLGRKSPNQIGYQQLAKNQIVGNNASAQLEQIANIYSFKIYRKSPPYLLEYKKYRVQISVDDNDTPIEVEIRNPNNISITSGKIQNRALETLFTEIQKRIERDIYSRSTYE